MALCTSLICFGVIDGVDLSSKLSNLSRFEFTWALTVVSMLVLYWATFVVSRMLNLEYECLDWEILEVLQMVLRLEVLSPRDLRPVLSYLLEETEVKFSLSGEFKFVAHFF